MLLFIVNLLLLATNLVTGFSFDSSSSSFSIGSSRQFSPSSHHERQRLKSFRNKCHDGHLLRMSSLSHEDDKEKKNIIVISPPGGIGEITATTLAREGCVVRWFVVDDDDNSNNSNNKFYLPRETWEIIKEKKGELDIAGGDASSILFPESNPNSIAENVLEWCNVNTAILSSSSAKNNVIVSCLDRGDNDDDEEEEKDRKISNAVKCVTQIACSKLPPAVKRIDIVPVPTEDGQKQQQKKFGEADWLSKTRGIFSGVRDIPTTLREAMSSSSTSGQDVNLLTLRYCNLFGSPESNIDATPFIGGPRRDPIIREEFLFRSAQLTKTKRLKKENSDPFRTSRLTIADAVSQLISSPIDVPKDITLSSLRGVESLSADEWNMQFQRLAATTGGRSTSARGSDDGVVVFEADFASVPSVPKLADWLALKWAPVVMGSYDIAGIRVGARPVYVTRTTNEDEKESVEIVWQELMNFEETVSVGKMVITVNKNGIIATRKLLQMENGASKLSANKPFPGELELVRRLADAAGQATEKGLAVKRKVEKQPQPVAVVASTATINATIQKPPSTIDFSGPKTSGAKRSSQRSRGKRTSEGDSTSNDADSSTNEE